MYIYTYKHTRYESASDRRARASARGGGLGTRRSFPDCPPPFCPFRSRAQIICIHLLGVKATGRTRVTTIR